MDSSIEQIEQCAAECELQSPHTICTSTTPPEGPFVCPSIIGSASTNSVDEHYVAELKWRKDQDAGSREREAEQRFVDALNKRDPRIAQRERAAKAEPNWR